MSGSAVKATNREIRRAFGADALDTIDRQGQAIQELQQRAGGTADKLTVEGIANVVATHTDALQVLADRRTAEAGSVWLRLRWLFRGR